MTDFDLTKTDLVSKTIDDSHAAAILEKLKYLLEHTYDPFNIPMYADSIELVVKSYSAAAQNILDAISYFNAGNDAVACGLVAAAGHACSIAKKYFAPSIKIQDWAEPLEQAIDFLVWKNLEMFQDQMQECSDALKGITEIASMINIQPHHNAMDNKRVDGTRK